MKKFFKASYISSVFFLLYFPILILITYSFNNAKYSLVWHGFSIKWYNALFQDSALWGAFLNSVFLGIVAAIIAVSLALFACINIFLNNSGKKERSLFSILLLLIIIPDLVLGVALLIFFNIFKIPLGFLSLLISHITFCIPFAILTLNTRIKTLDANIYFSALDLGASKFQSIKDVLLPLLWPAVFSALLLCFTLSFDDVIISYFVAGPDFNILPLTIFSLVRSGVTPELNALCSITLVISMLLVLTSQYLVNKS